MLFTEDGLYAIKFYNEETTLFHKNNIDQKEIVKKLVFIDAEFTCKNEDPKVKSPVSIAMVNSKGEFFMNVKINPRGRVLFFGTNYHGLEEEDLRGKWTNTNASGVSMKS